MFIDNINHQNIHANINFVDTIDTKKNTESNNFVNYLNRALGEISSTQNRTKVDAENFSLNQSNISLNDLMINLQKSSIAIQMAIQVKNKIVSAYQEIMNQQI